MNDLLGLDGFLLRLGQAPRASDDCSRGTAGNARRQVPAEFRQHGVA
ncbi:hypothetical protein [Roseomonas elaeocarpi]|uniref:Uncharacterized protein n=1 Tax=Roseomonas elaeocarpi TaxID=907779 RepID=A0ABV6JR13_9PROT